MVRKTVEKIKKLLTVEVLYLLIFTLGMLASVKHFSEAAARIPQLPVRQVFQCEVEPHFTPKEEMADIIRNELLKAEHSVYLSLFGISNRELTDTLIYLKRHNIDVQVGIDRQQAEADYSTIDELQAIGIPVYIKKTKVLEHNKFAVIDGKILITGSWNWSEKASRQDNNTVFIRCNGIAKIYQNEFTAIKNRDSVLK